MDAVYNVTLRPTCEQLPGSVAVINYNRVVVAQSASRIWEARRVALRLVQEKLGGVWVVAGCERADMCCCPECRGHISSSNGLCHVCYEEGCSIEQAMCAPDEELPSAETVDRLKWLVRHHRDDAPRDIQERYVQTSVFGCLVVAEKAGDSVEELVDWMASRKADSDTSKGPIDVLRCLGRELLVQDNRITTHPIFIVQQKVRDYGYDLSYTDEYEWRHVNDPEYEPDEDDIKRLESGEYGGDEWEKIGYRDRWEFVTAALTDKACRQFIEANRHNLNSPRVYAASGHRNREWVALRGALTDLATEDNTGRGDDDGSPEEA